MPIGHLPFPNSSVTEGWSEPSFLSNGAEDRPVSSIVRLALKAHLEGNTKAR
jgi:hypothetical protein